MNAILQDSYLTTDGISDVMQGGTGTSGQLQQALSQSFTTTSAYSILYIDIPIAKQGSPTDNCYITLGTTIGATNLGTSVNVEPGINLPTNSNLYFVRFMFSSPIALANSTKYYISFLRDGGVFDSINRYVWYGQSTNLYSGGNGGHRDNNSWVDSAASVADYNFRIYSSGGLINYPPYIQVGNGQSRNERAT